MAAIFSLFLSHKMAARAEAGGEVSPRCPGGAAALGGKAGGDRVAAGATRAAERGWGQKGLEPGAGDDWGAPAGGAAAPAGLRRRSPFVRPRPCCAAGSRPGPGQQRSPRGLAAFLKMVS